MSYQPRRPARHATIRLRGLPHHVTRWGPDVAEPLVFLHGWLDTSDTFQFVVDAFAQDHPIVALDWRGFGRSAWQNGPYWFPDYLADLDALLEEVSPGGPATLVGHSMGGNIACLYAGVRPERVARIVNLEGFGLSRTRPEQAPERYRRWLDELRAPPTFSSYDSFERFVALLARKNPRLTPERAAFIAASWSKRLPDGTCTVNADPAHKLVNPVLYRREETEAVWRCAVAPTLLVLGGRSEFRAHLGADGTDEYFRSIFTKLSIATLPEAGHMMHHEEPEAVAALIESFLAGTG
jgi:pimeloyl-ACP methyl ester carboxylesterase